MLNIRSALVAGLLTLGAAAAASAQAAGHAKQGKGRPNQRADAALLRGIPLTDAEKANVKAVHEKYASQEKTLRDQQKAQAEQMRALRQRGDTAAMAAARQASAPQRKAERQQAEQLARAERAELRGALAPAEQAKFDANAAKQRVAQRSTKGKGARKVPGATTGA